MTERRKGSIQPESATKMMTMDDDAIKTPEVDSATLPPHQMIELSAQRLHASKFLPKTRVISN